jgi:predicted nucleic acid-binding protein
MRLIVDANVLFAALIKNNLTAKLFISDDLQLFAPEFLFQEFFKYESTIITKTKRTKKDFQIFKTIIKSRIKIVQRKKIIPFMDISKKKSPDPKDTTYIACALATNSKIWSNDRELKEKQKLVEVITTSELIETLHI